MFVPSSNRERDNRRGNYSMMMAFAILPMLGFGALAMDISYIRLAQSEAQDVADAASNAALIALKTSSDPDTAIAKAQQAADLAISMNTVVGAQASRSDIQFGIFDETAIPPFNTVLSGSERPNAVKVSVARDNAHSNPVGAIFGNIFGRNNYNVGGTATSATRDLDIILVIDITNSYSTSNFNNARLASLSFMDIVSQSFGEEDQIGMVVFSGPFAARYTELKNIGDEVMNASRPIRTAWDKLKTASKPGEWRPNDGVAFTGPPIGTWTTSNINSGDGDCHKYDGSYKSSYQNNFGNNGTTDLSAKNNFGVGWTDLPANCYTAANGTATVLCSAGTVLKPSVGGCHPDMPREYVADGTTSYNEGGTDHWIGLQAAYDMFEEDATLTSYRAMVMLTDGVPNGPAAVPTNAPRGATNQRAGYSRGAGVLIGSAPPYTGVNYGETRWRMRAMMTGHTTAQVRTDAVSATQIRGASLKTNQWIVSFGPALTGADLAMMNGMTAGDGYYTNTTNSASIIPIFESIARSLPMAVVQ